MARKKKELPASEIIGGNAKEHLKSFIERIERLEEEKASLAEDIKEIFAEAKSFGFDPKIMRTVIRMRRQEPQQRDEYRETLDAYLGALGMLADTPLGQAAVEREFQQ